MAFIGGFIIGMILMRGIWKNVPGGENDAFQAGYSAGYIDGRIGEERRF